MKDNEALILAVGGVGIAALFVYISKQGEGNPVPVPSDQKEGMVMSTGIQGDKSLCAGTPLDPDPSIHFYSPGYDPVQGAQPMVESRHRYPAIPGGNISTVMHQGWSAMSESSPADNDWRINPPEVAVM